MTSACTESSVGPPVILLSPVSAVLVTAVEKHMEVRDIVRVCLGWG